MNIAVTEPPLKNKPQDSKNQTRFNKLWQDVKKKQKRNEKFKDDIEALFSTYTQKVMPVEKELEKPLALLAHRLIEFFGKKSLTKRHREELNLWIVQTLSDVAKYNAERAMIISDLYNQALADYYDISIEELLEDDESFDDEMDDEMAGSMDDLFGFDDDDDSEFEDPDSEAEDFFGNGSNAGREDINDGKPGRHEQLINDKWIKNLFRRTARVLHPDKEQDTGLRLEKERLMSRLLHARDEQDVLTMLQLYSEHVDDAELPIEKQEVDALCGLLQNQKYELDEAREDLIYKSPMHNMVYEHLYGASKKTRERKLKKLIEMLRHDVQLVFGQVEYLRNLSCLKAALEERTQERHYMDW